MPVRRHRPKAYVIAEHPRATEGCAGARPATSVRMAGRTTASRRIGMALMVFLAGFAALATRLAAVSFGGPVAATRVAAGDVAPDHAAEIVDRNGVLLATDLPMQALEVAGREVWSPDETAAALARVLPDIDSADLAYKLAEGRYLEVAPRITPAQAAEVFALGLPGIRFAMREQRYYPHGTLAAHLVGHGEAGRGGVMGLERYASRSASGPVKAALDVRAQIVLEHELSVAMETFHAIAAWGGVLDVETGEVIALASLPGFDPNAPGASPDGHRRNRAVYDLYELGSAFKVFTAAAVLDSGLATLETTYDARGSYRVADKVIRDFHGENRVLTLSEVVRFSSNIGAARMAADLGVERQREMLGRLGLLDALPIELAENRAPMTPRRWGPVESATISYGHGISVTPLHLLAAFAATVNGGVYRAPTFLAVDGLRSGKRVFSEKTSRTMRVVLREVITGGTASKADVEGYATIGKTATAEKPRAGGYDPNARISTFVGAFPGHAPRYAVLISLDEPKPVADTFGYATAGWNAAPAFAAVVRRLAPALGMMPSAESASLDTDGAAEGLGL